MPTQVYHARFGQTRDDGAVPKEWRLGGNYVRAGLVMDDALFAFVWFQPDYELNTEGSRETGRPTHRHPYDQVFYVISGHILFPVGNKALDGEDERDYDLLAGDALYIPRSVTHAQGMRILGDQPASAIEMFAPIRTDYLYIAEHQLTFNAPERQPDGSRIETRSFDEMTHQKEVNVARP